MADSPLSSTTHGHSRSHWPKQHDRTLLCNHGLTRLTRQRACTQLPQATLPPYRLTAAYCMANRLSSQPWHKSVTMSGSDEDTARNIKPRVVFCVAHVSPRERSFCSVATVSPRGLAQRKQATVCSSCGMATPQLATRLFGNQDRYACRSDGLNDEPIACNDRAISVRGTWWWCTRM